MMHADWSIILSSLLVVAACGAPSDSMSSSNTEVVDKLERAVRLKSLLKQLDSLPDSDLRELLLQLRALRRSRTTPPPRDLTKIPIGQLTEDELFQIANIFPNALRHHAKKPYVPLDIPHDLTRIPIAKFIEAFRIVHPESDLTALEIKVKHNNEAVFGEEERQGDAAQKGDVVRISKKGRKQPQTNATEKTPTKRPTESKPLTPTTQPDDEDLDADT